MRNMPSKSFLSYLLDKALNGFHLLSSIAPAILNEGIVLPTRNADILKGEINFNPFCGSEI